MNHAPRPNGYRDSWAGELTAERAGTQARVAGWVHRRRDHGGLIFIDLRDRSGIVQLVFHPDSSGSAHALAHRLRSEDVLSAAGTVSRRDPANVNPNLATGEIELAGRSLKGQLKQADRIGARYVAIIGDSAQVSLKEMEGGNQRELPATDVIPTILRASRLS